MTPFELATRFAGVGELRGGEEHPLIQWWLSLCSGFGLHTPDETPWCSAFVNGICWELRLARSKLANARSWLDIGTVVQLADAVVGYDVVVLSRGSVLAAVDDRHAPGHVGFYAGREGTGVVVLAGNQGDKVSLQTFPAERILGIRRVQ